MPWELKGERVKYTCLACQKVVTNFRGNGSPGQVMYYYSVITSQVKLASFKSKLKNCQ